MSRGQRQHGFTLITAIFLLTVVAALVVFMTNIRVAQQTSLVYGVQGAHAIQAARSGIEWGIHESIVNGSCAASTTFTIARPTLDNFSVEVQCGATTHTEGVTPITTYQLVSIASAGVFGSLDYVRRGIQATVSRAPP